MTHFEASKFIINGYGQVDTHRCSYKYRPELHIEHNELVKLQTVQFYRQI